MDEPGSPLRRSVIVVMGLMLAVWVALYFFSFNEARGQADPAQFSFRGQSAKVGKKVFQAYNCMGCHTIVGNGAYFAPDLTNIVDTVGPAWLAAYLPSAGTWPTEALLGIQIERMAEEGLIEQKTLAAYYAAYPGARERIEQRGGRRANMPNLPFRPGEIDALIAFFAYTSAMDTEGWPPAVEARAGIVRQTRESLHRRAGVLSDAPQAPRNPREAPAEDAAPGQAAVAEPARANALPDGEHLAASYGCTACHSTGSNRMVGPGWGNLYGSERTLSNGSTVKVDDAYLAAAILEPDRQVPQGYVPGVMPSFAGKLKPQELDALVAYIRSLAQGDR